MNFKSTAAAASVAGAFPTTIPPAYTLSQLVIVAACGARKFTRQMRIQIQLQIQIQIQIQIRIRVWAQKHFHFISFRCMRCELKGKATGECWEGGRGEWEKKYASGRNLCQVTAWT